MKMCRCKECKHYTKKTEITGYCNLMKSVTVANASCGKSEKAPQKEQDIADFLNGFGINI